MKKLNYKYFNNSKPLIVMIHGLQSSLDTFMPIVGEFIKEYDLLLVDQRGHGESEPFGDDYSAHKMARDLKELIDHLGVKKAHFLGHSMGGRTVMAFHELYPDMCDSLIIEDIGIHIRQQQSPEKDKERQMMAEKSKVDSLIFYSKEEIFNLISPLYSYANELMKTKVVDLSDGRFQLKFWPHVSVLYGYQGNNTDFTDSLKNSKVPILFLIADFKIGSALTESCLHHIEKEVPNARIVHIKDSGHSIHKTHPNEFCNEIKNFIA